MQPKDHSEVIGIKFAGNGDSRMVPPRAGSGIRATLLAALEEARTVALTELPEFLGELERVRVTALARLSSPVAVHAEPDERVDISTAAKRLGVSKHYLYKHHKRFSFCKPEGRKLLFSARGIEQHIKRPR